MAKIIPLLKAIIWELWYRFFSSVFRFCKISINETVSFIDHASEIRLPDCCKLAINRKEDNDVAICRHEIIISFFLMLPCFNFSYWSKFHVNNMIGSGIMTIFVYKELTRNPEIKNTLVWVLSNIWRLGQVKDTKFANAANTKYRKMPGLQLLPFLSYEGKTNRG